MEEARATKKLGERQFSFDENKKIWVTSNSTVTELSFPGVYSFAFGAEAEDEWSASDAERLLRDAEEVERRNTRAGVAFIRTDTLDAQTNRTRIVSFMTIGPFVEMGLSEDLIRNTVISFFKGSK